jgi:tetratricopeptide (TPR) repeat protein
MRASVAVPLSGALGGLLAAFGANLAPAQSANEGSRIDNPARRTPTIRLNVFEDALECDEADDLECMRAALERIRARTDLNSFETAQMWSFYAHMYVEQDDFPAAIRAYQNVLAEPDITVGLETTTLRSLATLYTQEEQYEPALEALERWFGLEPMPSADAYVLNAQILYQLQRFRGALDPIRRALELAQAQGREPQEGWYQLLAVIYLELEDYPNVIETTTFLAEHWTKAEYVKRLAALYSQVGQEQQMLALFEASYEAGWLESSSELVTLASLLLNADIPYKAARILEAGLEAGTVDSTAANWRLLAQAWQLAQDDERALPALARASALAPDGEVDLMLAQSYANLYRWEPCVESARDALRRGVAREDLLRIMLGSCLLESKHYDEARNAFRQAARDERSRANAEQWLQYLHGEEARVRGFEQMVPVR